VSHAPSTVQRLFKLTSLPPLFMLSQIFSAHPGGLPVNVLGKMIHEGAFYRMQVRSSMTACACGTAACAS